MFRQELIGGAYSEMTVTMRPPLWPGVMAGNCPGLGSRLPARLEQPAGDCPAASVKDSQDDQ
jgi:hypothetical protein